MRTTPEPQVRELDRRTSDGIDVTLLWDSHTDSVSVAVLDHRSGESIEFEVDPADAVAAFHHPFAHVDAEPSSPERRVRHRTARDAGATGQPREAGA